MRKQDRIAHQQQSQPQPGAKPQQGPRPQEQVKGSASQDPSKRPDRQPGKLPLPD